MNYIATPSEIREKIELEILNDKSLGHLKNDLVFMFVDTNSKIYLPIKYAAIFQSIIIIPIPLFNNVIFLKNYLFLVFLPVIICVFFLFLHILCSHYLVYDLKKNSFYTVSLLFNSIPLDILQSESVKLYRIEKIILQTKYETTGNNTALYDKIIALLDDNTEVELTEIMSSIKYHNILVNRCNFFSDCCNIDFFTRGDTEKIEDEMKSHESSMIFIYIIIFICISLLPISVITSIIK